MSDRPGGGGPTPRHGKPLLGRIPGLEGLIVATGLGPSGLTIGPCAGRLAAEQHALGADGGALKACAPQAQATPPATQA